LNKIEKSYREKYFLKYVLTLLSIRNMPNGSEKRRID